jgi:hypothetical protein
VVGLLPNYNPREVRSDDFQCWHINHQLFGMIYDYYSKNRDPSIFVDARPESFDEDGNWIYAYCGIEAAEESRKRAADPDGGGKKKSSKKGKK